MKKIITVLSLLILTGSLSATTESGFGDGSISYFEFTQTYENTLNTTYSSFGDDCEFGGFECDPFNDPYSMQVIPHPHQPGVFICTAGKCEIERTGFGTFIIRDTGDGDTMTINVPLMDSSTYPYSRRHGDGFSVCIGQNASACSGFDGYVGVGGIT